MNKKLSIALGVIFGIIFLIIGLVYATHPAGSLPHFFPGFEAGVSAVHVKHSIASFIVGIACLVFAWFQSGPKQG